MLTLDIIWKIIEKLWIDKTCSYRIQVSKSCWRIGSSKDYTSVVGDTDCNIAFWLSSVLTDNFGACWKEIGLDSSLPCQMLQIPIYQNPPFMISIFFSPKSTFVTKRREGSPGKELNGWLPAQGSFSLGLFIMSRLNRCVRLLRVEEVNARTEVDSCNNERYKVVIFISLLKITVCGFRLMFAMCDVHTVSVPVLVTAGTGTGTWYWYGTVSYRQIAKDTYGGKDLFVRRNWY